VKTFILLLYQEKTDKTPNTNVTWK